MLTADPRLVDSRKYLGPARDVVAVEVTRLLRLLHPVGRSPVGQVDDGSTGQAMA